MVASFVGSYSPLSVDHSLAEMIGYTTERERAYQVLVFPYHDNINSGKDSPRDTQKQAKGHCGNPEAVQVNGLRILVFAEPI